MNIEKELVELRELVISHFEAHEENNVYERLIELEHANAKRVERVERLENNMRPMTASEINMAWAARTDKQETIQQTETIQPALDNLKREVDMQDELKVEGMEQYIGELCYFGTGDNALWHLKEISGEYYIDENNLGWDICRPYPQTLRLKELEQEAKTREKIWLGRLDDADKRYGKLQNQKEQLKIIADDRLTQWQKAGAERDELRRRIAKAKRYIEQVSPTYLTGGDAVSNLNEIKNRLTAKE